MSALESSKDIQAAPGTGVTFAAFAADEVTKQAMMEVARCHWPGALVVDGGLAAAIAHVASQQSPQLLAVDLGDDENPKQSLMQLAEKCGPETELVALGTVNDVFLYRELINAGVADYLIKPVSVELLEDALLAAALRPAQTISDQPETERLAEVVCVIGARGGVGASTIAVNAAWIMAEERGKKVALIDLDLNYGTTALALDLVPAGGLIEVLQHPERVDSLFIARSMLPKSERLSVLASEHELGSEATFDHESLDIMLAEVRRGYDWVWIDIPRSFCHDNESVLATANRVLLVSDLSLASMRDAARLSAYCEEKAPKSQLSIILNRVGGNRGGGLTVKQFERGFQRSVDRHLQDDPDAAGAASSGGQPVSEVASRSKLTRGLREIVDELLGGAQQRRGLFRRRVSEAET
ncbi:MAG: AAA family ATPase [Alphaproteobacteria bacterium]